MDVCLFCVCVSVCLPIYLSTYLSVCLSVCMSVCLPICLSIHLFIHLASYLSTNISVSRLYLLGIAILWLVWHVHPPNHSNTGSQRLVLVNIAERIQKLDDSGLASCDQAEGSVAIVGSGVDTQLGIG